MECLRKIKGGIGEKYSMVMAYTNLTSICCVYKEKMVKHDSYRGTQRPYIIRKLQYTTQIVNKSI